MRNNFISPELVHVSFPGLRFVDFKYRLRLDGASSVFDGQAEVVNNNTTDYNDVICIDPGTDFWKFLARDDSLCDWNPLKEELTRRWKSQSSSVIAS